MLYCVFIIIFTVSGIKWKTILKTMVPIKCKFYSAEFWLYLLVQMVG